MYNQTNEQALEAAIEKQLTGTTLEAIKAKGNTVDGVSEARDFYRGGNGYYIGQPLNFNSQFAIDEQYFWSISGNHPKRRTRKTSKTKRLEVKNSQPF